MDESAEIDLVSEVDHFTTDIIDPEPSKSPRIMSGLTIKDILEILSEADHLESARDAIEILDEKRLQIKKGFLSVEC